jgi:dual specificity protein kinase YAK1
MDSWSYTSDAAANRQSRYASNALPPNSATSPQHPREYASQPPSQQQNQNHAAQQGYQTYHGQAGTAAVVGSTNPRLENSNNEYMDVQMQDADSYGRGKFQQQPQQQARQPFLSDDPSSQTQRYSPMPQQYTAAGSSQPTNLPPMNAYPQHRQSPSRSTYTNATQSYYSQNAAANSPRTGALPPIQNYQSSMQQHSGPPPAIISSILSDPGTKIESVGTDPNGGRYFAQPSTSSQASHMYEPNTPAHPTPPRDPPPRLQRVTGLGDLQPRINAQPAHRRANPEGGFISVGIFPGA